MQLLSLLLELVTQVVWKAAVCTTGLSSATGLAAALWDIDECLLIEELCYVLL